MLTVKNLVKIYDNNKKAVDNISFEIKDGEIFGFIGPNGAGKTTTIKAIMGLITFESGLIDFDGINIVSNPIEFKKKVVYIPDNPDLYESLTGIQYLNFIGDVYNVNKEIRKEIVEKYAKLFEIYNDLNNLVGSYSHGMKQKLAIISAFLHSPKLLILDEPFVGLDPKAAFLVKQAMSDFCKNGGAIFFSTHVLEVAEKLCNKIAIIKKGQLIVSGDMEEVTKDASLEEVFMEHATNE